MAEEQQTLFSLELDVDFVHIKPSGISCRIPAVAFRLMDFPTLLIHHMKAGNIEKIKANITTSHDKFPMQLSELKDHRGNFVFKKGKSCLFKSSIKTLIGHLSNTPLYVMILDMWPDVPKLVGNCSVPLQSSIEKIASDVERTGVSVPTVDAIKDYYKVYNLMGSEIGYVSLGFKLLSLGAGLISHIPESSITKPLSTENAVKNASKTSKDYMRAPSKQSGNVVLEDLKQFEHDDVRPIKILVNKETEQLSRKTRSSSTQTRQHPDKKKQTMQSNVKSMNQSLKEDDEINLFITNTVCPPPLFLNSKCEDLQQYKADDVRNKELVYSPDPEESEEESFSSNNGFVESHYIYPSNNQQSVRKVHRRPHHKQLHRSDVREPQPECSSIGIQSSPDVRSITSGLINQNLPILAALLRELSVLQGNRPLNPQQGHSPHQQVLSSPSTGAHLRPTEQVIANTKKERPDEVMVGSFKRPRSAKKKPPLRYGMTTSQKLRLQMNNPELLKTLEREEAKKYKEKLVMSSTYKTPRKTLRKKNGPPVRKQFGVSSDDSEKNKENQEVKGGQRPNPAPRHLQHVSSTTIPGEEEIKSYMSITGSDTANEKHILQNGERSSHETSNDGSEASSLHIEVHIPSASANQSDSDTTADFTDQSDADITISHISPKKTIEIPGFSTIGQPYEYRGGQPANTEIRKEEETHQVKDLKSNDSLVAQENDSKFSDNKLQRSEVSSKPDLMIEPAEFETNVDGEVLEGAHFEEYSNDFEVDDNKELEATNKEDILEYAEFEGSYSYDFEKDDQSQGFNAGPLQVVDDQEDIDTFASLSTTTSSEESLSQRSIRNPVPQSSRLQVGSLTIPKPTLSSKSPLPNKKTGSSTSVYPRTDDATLRRNVDDPNMVTGSSVHSEFLTGDSDSLQSTGTGKTRSSDDRDYSYSDLFSDGSKEF